MYLSQQNVVRLYSGNMKTIHFLRGCIKFVTAAILIAEVGL